MTPPLNEGQFRVLRKASDVVQDSDDSLRRSNLFEVWNDPERKTTYNDWGHKQRDVETLAGQPMRREELPEYVYHVTTNKPAVEQSGHLRAGSLGRGETGLGGSHSGTVSLTLSEGIAHQLKHDLRNYAMMVQSGSQEATMDLLHRESERHGVPRSGWEAVERAHELSGPESRAGHGAYVHYLTGVYYAHRRHAGADLRNPVIVGGAGERGSQWEHIDPSNIDVIKIHRDQIPQEALVSSFDTDQNRHGVGLNEVRVHADIPLGRQF